jgi:hypothetical protein
MILVGLECHYKQKGVVQSEPPLNGVASKMPLLIFLPEKCTNIPGTPDNVMQCFRRSRVCVNFFTDETKRAAHWNRPALDWLKYR